MIEIYDLIDFYDEVIDHTVPEALACAVSTRFQRLCSSEKPDDENHKMCLQDLLRGCVAYGDFQRSCGRWNAASYLSWFICWLYTSQLNY